MFTGIVEELGTVISMKLEENIVLWNNEVAQGYVLIVSGKIILEDAYIGCSIAVNGTCLTLTEVNGDQCSFGCSLETLSKTNLGELKAGDLVNLERSMSVNARNSGHFVQGHVDDTGKILDFTKSGDSLWVKIQVSPQLMPYIVPKGFIAVDGTSLTICEVNRSENWFNLMLVAFTQQHIIMPKKKVGSLVNIEVDIMAKHTERSVASLKERIDKLQRNVVIFTGVASLVGLTFGTLLGRLSRH